MSRAWLSTSGYPKADIEERRVMSYLIPHLCLSDAAELDNGRASVIWSVFTSPKIKFFTVRMEGVAKVCVPTVLLCKLTR